MLTKKKLKTCAKPGPHYAHGGFHVRFPDARAALTCIYNPHDLYVSTVFQAPASFSLLNKHFN